MAMVVAVAVVIVGVVLDKHTFGVKFVRETSFGLRCRTKQKAASSRPPAAVGVGAVADPALTSDKMMVRSQICPPAYLLLAGRPVPSGRVCCYPSAACRPVRLREAPTSPAGPAAPTRLLGSSRLAG